MNKIPEQPPIDNAHVAPGCDPFVTASDYVPTSPERLVIRRVLTRFASSDAKLVDCENEIVDAFSAQAPELTAEVQRLRAINGELVGSIQKGLEYAAEALCHLNTEHPAFNSVKAIHREARSLLARWAQAHNTSASGQDGGRG